MRSKEVEEGIGHLEMLLDYGILASEDEPHIKTVLNYISDLEKYVDKLKIEKNNLINEKDKLIEEYNKTGEFVNNQIYREKNYIHKDKIKDKIKELEDKFDFFAGREHAEWQDGEFDGDVCDDIALQIKVLKELLGEKND